MTENGRKWSKIDFRGYLVENGFSRFLHHGHRGSQEDNGRNGRKWQKKVHRGYLVENGFSRIYRLFPTTKSIHIGEKSFRYFAGKFELKNLPQLQSIQIGSLGYDSSNFYWSSFVIRGIDLILNN